MPIKKPESHLGHGSKSKTAAKAMGHGRKSTFASLNLTPMIDMFVMMIIFLLMTFSASGEILFVQKDIKLPDAQQFTELDRAPVVAITHPDAPNPVVTLDGREVATVRELNDSDNPDWKIPRLVEDLEVLQHNCRLVHPDDADQVCGAIIVQSDRNVPFKVLKKIMYSAGLAKYANVNFAVTAKAGGEVAAAHE